jgi:hypothetical protein
MSEDGRGPASRDLAESGARSRGGVWRGFGIGGGEGSGRSETIDILVAFERRDVV